MKTTKVGLIALLKACQHLLIWHLSMDVWMLRRLAWKSVCVCGSVCVCVGSCVCMSESVFACKHEVFEYTLPMQFCGRKSILGVQKDEVCSCRTVSHSRSLDIVHWHYTFMSTCGFVGGTRTCVISALHTLSFLSQWGVVMVGISGQEVQSRTSMCMKDSWVVFVAMTSCGDVLALVL